uniref:Uncharacterized protein n=1 Tax=Anguilla anguilla TaxID=7936 RepID=A0A0E9V8R2_ANGAN
MTFLSPRATPSGNSRDTLKGAMEVHKNWTSGEMAVIA